jgi:hypothetical protein
MSKADKLLKRIEFYEKMASSQKPESDDLLKKASLFERLALYSDRKSFLEAVAQAAPADPNRALINKALQLMQQAGVDEATTAPLGNAVLFNKVDIPAIQRAIQNARFKLNPLTQQNVINELMSISGQLKATLTPEEEAQKAMSGPPDIEFGFGNGLPPINPNDQKAVFQFAVEMGQLVPDPAKQKPDGQLGPETRKALEGVKNYFAKQNPQNPRMTDQQAIQAAKFKGRQ